MKLNYSVLAALFPLIAAMPLPVQLNFTVITLSADDYSLSSTSYSSEATSQCINCANSTIISQSSQIDEDDSVAGNNSDDLVYLYTDEFGNEYIIDSNELYNSTNSFGINLNQINKSLNDADAIVLSDNSPLFVSYADTSDHLQIEGVQNKLFGWGESSKKNNTDDESYSLPDFGYQSVEIKNNSISKLIRRMGENHTNLDQGSSNEIQNKNFYKPVLTIPMFNKPSNGSGFQQVDVFGNNSNDSISSLDKRSLLFNIFHKVETTSNQKQIEVSLDKSNGLYLLPIRIGFFNHKVSLLLDTESSDMVIRSNDAESFIPKRNVFNPFYSSTFNEIGPDFKTSLSNIVIEDQVNTFKSPPQRGSIDTTGFWGSDDVVFNIHDEISYKVQNNIIGFARKTDLQYDGVLGLGPKTEESSVVYANKTNYDSFFYAMKNQSLTDEAGFTLNFNKSSVTFGKLNSTDFENSVTLNFESKRNGMYFDLDSFQYGNKELTTNGATKAKISTVSTYTKIPKSIFDSTFKGKFGNYSQNYGNYLVDCNLAKNSNFNDLKFTFDGTEVNVPFEKLIVQEFPKFLKVDQCVLGVVANDENEDEFVLGRAFLESTPVHYNLESSQITIAGN